MGGAQGCSDTLRPDIRLMLAFCALFLSLDEISGELQSKRYLFLKKHPTVNVNTFKQQYGLSEFLLQYPIPVKKPGTVALVCGEIY